MQGYIPDAQASNEVAIVPWAQDGPERSPKVDLMAEWRRLRKLQLAQVEVQEFLRDLQVRRVNRGLDRRQSA